MSDLVQVAHDGIGAEILFRKPKAQAQELVHRTGEPCSKSGYYRITAHVAPARCGASMQRSVTHGESFSACTSCNQPVTWQHFFADSSAPSTGARVVDHRGFVE
ncbi:MAG: hypothetical protein ACREN2_06110 [Candidatus Dormibacteria bacterium]